MSVKSIFYFLSTIYPSTTALPSQTAEVVCEKFDDKNILQTRLALYLMKLTMERGKKNRKTCQVSQKKSFWCNLPM